MKWWYPSTSDDLIILCFFADKNKTKKLFFDPDPDVGGYFKAS